MEPEKLLEASKKAMSLRRICLQHMLTQYGLHPGQPEMLLYIRQNPGCSQRQMAEDAGVTAASVAASFKRMENVGLIRRRSDTADLRCNRVYLTEKGEDALLSCMQEVQVLNQCMLRGLQQDEIDVLCRCVDKIIENLLSAKGWKYPEEI